ncbi:double zinc ribbon domain-containing protein [Glacieibacterium sp.]|uniref:double zinc ribbon domain-containing protein n=1 Tax=Glacieibacterium sp. TaxID=2860237 RepID=UPI003B0021B1
MEPGAVAQAGTSGLRILARGGAVAANWLLDVLLPPRCPACRDVVRIDGSFCAGCWAGLRFLTAPWCARCGLPFAHDLGDASECGACLLKPPRYTTARSALAYDGTARPVLLGFKHGDRQHLARLMAPQLARVGMDWLGPDSLLVPVPLHRSRLWQRGFNQAALLARLVGRRTGTPLLVDGLKRVKRTRLSRGMNRRQRTENVRSAFRVARPTAITGRRIVLIDDVLTTGATVEACSRVLLRAGATSVHVLTWARVVRDA